MRIKEVTPSAYPRSMRSAGLMNYIDVPTQLIPNFFTPGLGPEFIAGAIRSALECQRWDYIDQLIFDGSYMVGLKATRTLAERAGSTFRKRPADARNQAAKAYFGVLAAEEGAKLAGEGIPLLEKALREVNAMLDADSWRTTDVDRITIQLEQARTQQRSFVQQAEVARLLLALTLGLPQGTPMTLTDDLTQDRE
jgi:outer membrane protein